MAPQLIQGRCTTGLGRVGSQVDCAVAAEPVALSSGILLCGADHFFGGLGKLVCALKMGFYLLVADGGQGPHLWTKTVEQYLDLGDQTCVEHLLHAAGDRRLVQRKRQI